MKLIYQNARLVLCWLGPAANGSDDIFELLQALYDAASDQKVQRLYLHLLGSQSMLWVQSGLLDLLKRTYWQRL